MADSQGMRAIEDLEGNALKWIKPAGGRYYELVGAGDVYATLKWEGVFGSLATGRTSDLDFTFKRAGFMMPYVTVRKIAYDQEIGKMRMGFGGNGLLEFADGRRFSFTKTGFWNPEWAFCSDDGRRLCTFTMASTLTKRQADVLLDPDGRRLPNVIMLLILGWYVIILQAEEAATAASSTAAFTSMQAAAAAGTAAAIPPPPSH